jgi:hypothetical protein
VSRPNAQIELRFPAPLSFDNETAGALGDALGSTSCQSASSESGRGIVTASLPSSTSALPSRPMSNIQAQIHVLARHFVDQVVEVLRGASLRDLISHDGGPGGAVGNGRPARSAAPNASVAPVAALAPKATRPNGRLARRSADEIQATLDKIVTLLRKQKDGLRAEEIRSNLGMLAKEMPRILKEGLSTKKLTSKGQKRATTYFAK